MLGDDGIWRSNRPGDSLGVTIGHSTPQFDLVPTITVNFQKRSDELWAVSLPGDAEDTILRSYSDVLKLKIEALRDPNIVINRLVKE